MSPISDQVKASVVVDQYNVETLYTIVEQWRSDGSEFAKKKEFRRYAEYVAECGWIVTDR